MYTPKTRGTVEVPTCSERLDPEAIGMKGSSVADPPNPPTQKQIQNVHDSTATCGTDRVERGPHPPPHHYPLKVVTDGKPVEAGRFEPCALEIDVAGRWGGATR